MRYCLQGAEGIKLKYNYTSSKYELEIKLVLNNKGRYITHLGEDTNFIDEGTEEGEYIRNFPFEGRCPIGSRFANIIDSGDDNLDYFETELLYIDKELALDQWTTWGSHSLCIYGSGSLKWE